MFLQVCILQTLTTQIFTSNCTECKCKCITLHIIMHTFGGRLVYLLHLRRAFLIRVFKSRQRPLFAFLRINNCIELNSVWQNWSRTRRQGFFEVWISIWLCIRLTVSRGKSDFIFEEENAKYTFEFPFKYAAHAYCILQCTRHPAKLAPPALIYALNNARLHNVCNQKCI